MFTFEELQRQGGGGRPLSGWRRTVYGSSAGVFLQFVTYPLDDVRTRITGDRKKYSLILGSLVRIIYA
jgi:hypothetical protein